MLIGRQCGAIIGRNMRSRSCLKLFFPECGLSLRQRSQQQNEPDRCTGLLIGSINLQTARYLGTLSSTFNYHFNDLFFVLFHDDWERKVGASGEAKLFVWWSRGLRNVAMHEACFHLCFAVFLSSFSDGTIQFCELISRTLAILTSLRTRLRRISAARSDSPFWCHFAFKLVKQPVQASHETLASPWWMSMQRLRRLQQAKRTRKNTSKKLWMKRREPDLPHEQPTRRFS